MSGEELRRIASDNVSKLVARGGRSCAVIAEDTRSAVPDLPGVIRQLW